jgi:hypothetical protein
MYKELIGDQMVRKVEYYSDNSRYEGDFINGDFCGKGILHFSNGGRYEGDFADGKFRGKIQDSTEIYSESGNAPNGKTDDENPT